MEKKVYISPLMKEVKIKTIKMLAASPEEVGVHSVVSNNASYSRGSKSDWGDDED